MATRRRVSDLGMLLALNHLYGVEALRILVENDIYGDKLQQLSDESDGNPVRAFERLQEIGREANLYQGA